MEVSEAKIYCKAHAVLVSTGPLLKKILLFLICSTNQGSPTVVVLFFI